MKYKKPCKRNRNLMRAVKLNYNDYAIDGDKKPAEKDGKLLMLWNPRLGVWKYL